MTELHNPHRRRPRICEVCSAVYIPTYSKQRSCSRQCGLRIKYGKNLYANKPLDKRALDAPLTAERIWIQEQQKQKNSDRMLERYHADPRNWTTARKRRRLFDRDGWKCRACGITVTDTVHRSHPRRAVAGHIQARARGGEWTDQNMATLCYPCNVADGVNKIPLQISAF